MTKVLSVKDYEKTQHYKDRRPPWIKMYVELLDDYDFLHLPDNQKWHYLGLLLLASQYENKMPFDLDFLRKKIGATTEIDLKPRFFRERLLANCKQIASNMLADCKQSARPETETETETETEGETETDIAPKGFDLFWEKYPKKKSKGDAKKAWAKLKPDEPLQDRILRALERAKTSEQWLEERGKFIPYPASWLNAEGWEDEHKVTVLPIRPALPRVTPALPKGEDCPPEAAALLAKLGGIGKVF